MGRALLLLIACAGCASSPVEEQEEEPLTGCGVERWAVKTGTDPLAASVTRAPVETTIGALGLRAVPDGGVSGYTTRTPPTETTVFLLRNANLWLAKLESDSDYHLVLQDAAGGASSLIAEIPAPSCVDPSSVFTSAIAKARSDFDAHENVGTSFVTINTPVTVTGVGFFDVLHGQTGVAPNGIELHPVLSICFGRDCLDAGTDAGPSDAGMAADAGTSADAGTTGDAGSAPDAGPPVDAGIQADAGAASDGGGPTVTPFTPSSGCASASGATFLAFLAAVLARRRRRSLR